MTVTAAQNNFGLDGNRDIGAVLTLAAEATGGASNRFVTHKGRGIKLVIDITAITAGSLTVTLRGRDNVTGKAWTVLASAALGATGTTVLAVYPGLTAAANSVANDHLPPCWDVNAVVATGPVTATISAHILD